MIKQLSIFLENKPSSLAKIMGEIAEAGINIMALSVADTADFGILRIIVDEPDKALEIVRQHGYIARVTDVMAVRIEHRPGALAEVLRKISDAGGQVEYMYASVSGGGEALAIMSVSGSERLRSLESTFS